MDYWFISVWGCLLLPEIQHAFNFDTNHHLLHRGPAHTQFGYTVQQHWAGGRPWLLVGAPFEFSDGQQTGDVYRCPLDVQKNCSRLHLGRVSLEDVSERKDQMKLGMSLTSNPKDQSFVACGPLWSHECGSSFYSTGICSRIGRNFKFTSTIAPALQRCETFMDIVIVLDGSNSIYPWYEVQNFLIKILEKFYMGRGQTQVGVLQYGSRVVHEFSLSDYQTVEQVVAAAHKIEQRGGEETRTSLGINKAREEAFGRGGRRGAKKVMIVITDGESHDSAELPRAVALSKEDNITLYAIAVLGSYNRLGINPASFLKEIKFIASDPDDQHFFKVTDESALKDIVGALGERIFSIEGTNTQEGRRFGLQMAQAGFSSHLVQDGVLVGAVGAYDWNGAVLKQTLRGKVIPPRASYLEEFPESMQKHAAYLGYAVGSMVTARKKQLYVAGAPRFNHTGKVMVFTMKNSGHLSVLHTLLGQQIGSYFGSELASVDLDADGDTDVLLVAAPMYYSQGWERGRVYMYALSAQNTLVQQGVLEVTERAQNSRLGSALAPVPDMNGDGFAELVVGAPLEDDHRGAVYVFFGERSRIQRTYRQRISAVSLGGGLQYFGRSLHGVLDLNADGLVDLAVGALGGVVTIWSRQVLRISTRVTFEPEKVNLFNKDCQRGGKDVSCMSLTVCLLAKTASPAPPVSPASPAPPLGVWLSLGLDERRVPPRAVLDQSDDRMLRLSLFPGQELCRPIHFFVQETADHGRPIVFLTDTGLRSPDDGPVLDPDWPSALRTELPFWNGCEHEERCRPDLVLHTHTDLPTLSEFCGRSGGRAAPCRQRGARGPAQGAMVSGDPAVRWGAEPPEVWVVEWKRRRVVVSGRLENRGENAYAARLMLRHSHNLLLSSILVKDQSDLQIECQAELANQRSCNISAPFMRSKTVLSFQVEFEFSQQVFLDHLEVEMESSSEGIERNPEDNMSHLRLPLKYQAELLFTRHPAAHHFDISPSHSSSPSPSSSSSLNATLTYQVQNLALFPVSDLLLVLDLWAVTPAGSQLLTVTAHSPLLASGGHCTLPTHRAPPLEREDDLTHTPQMNRSNSRSVVVGCRLAVAPGGSLRLSFTAKLQQHTLATKVKFRALEMVATAYLHLEPNSSSFLPEEKPTRLVVLEIRKEPLSELPVLVLLGSVLGGLVLLALLVLVLWRLGFFRRRTQTEAEEEGEGSALTNEKTAENLL